MLTPFDKKVLRCVPETSKTSEEIFILCKRMYPPSLIGKVLKIGFTERQVYFSLERLVKEGFVLRDLTRFIETALSHDTPIYRISNEGRSHLHKKTR